MSGFLDAYRRGRREALAEYGPPPPFFNKRRRLSPAAPGPVPREEVEREPVEPTSPAADDDLLGELKALAELSRSLAADNDRLVAELEACKAAKQQEESKTLAHVKNELRQSHAENRKLRAELTDAREAGEIACSELREQIEELSASQKPPGRGRGGRE